MKPRNKNHLPSRSSQSFRYASSTIIMYRVLTLLYIFIVLFTQAAEICAQAVNKKEDNDNLYEGFDDIYAKDFIATSQNYTLFKPSSDRKPHNKMRQLLNEFPEKEIHSRIKSSKLTQEKYSNHEEYQANIVKILKKLWKENIEMRCKIQSVLKRSNFQIRLKLPEEMPSRINARFNKGENTINFKVGLNLTINNIQTTT